MIDNKGLAAAIKRYEAEHGITKVKPGVAIGMKKSDYLPRESGGGGRVAAPLQGQDDPKYMMYFKALPKSVQQHVADNLLDPRELYKEYRKLGKEALIRKYVS